jgi:hypothetical protein
MLSHPLGHPKRQGRFSGLLGEIVSSFSAATAKNSAASLRREAAAQWVPIPMYVVPIIKVAGVVSRWLKDQGLDEVSGDA